MTNSPILTDAEISFFERALGVDSSHELFFRFFDAREPTVKRKDFNSRREKIISNLLQELEYSCYLKLEGICEKQGPLEIDHM